MVLKLHPSHISIFMATLVTFMWDYDIFSFSRLIYKSFVSIYLFIHLNLSSTNVHAFHYKSWNYDSCIWFIFKIYLLNSLFLFSSSFTFLIQIYIYIYIKMSIVFLYKHNTKSYNGRFSKLVINVRFLVASKWNWS